MRTGKAARSKCPGRTLASASFGVSLPETNERRSRSISHCLAQVKYRVAPHHLANGVDFHGRVRYSCLRWRLRETALFGLIAPLSCSCPPVLSARQQEYPRQITEEGRESPVSRGGDAAPSLLDKHLF